MGDVEQIEESWQPENDENFTQPPLCTASKEDETSYGTQFSPHLGMKGLRHSDSFILTAAGPNKGKI